jgi:hypothetical protein
MPTVLDFFKKNTEAKCDEKLNGYKCLITAGLEFEVYLCRGFKPDSFAFS